MAERATELAATAGDFIEQSVGNRIDGGLFEAPVLEDEAETNVWYRVPIEDGMAGDGSGFHIYIKKGTTENLCIFFSGGGVAWNEKMASLPVTGGRVAAWQPNYYWNNLRPFTQIMNINVGITETRDFNPFHDWSFAVITYATGDFHLGSNTFLYKDDDGQEQVLHFVGHDNFRLSMERIKELFPEPGRLLIAGDSAGAFATPALSPEVIDDYYSDVPEITLFSDSAMLLRAGWRDTIKDMWNAPESIYEPIHTSNITADWYEHMTKKYGSRCKYLYASSTHDYLLSAFINEERSGEYYTDEATQAEYAASLRRMYERMSSFDEKMHFFIYDYRMPAIFGRGGTIHTAVRSPHFYIPGPGGATMSQWLFDAVGGNLYDVGTDLI
ncbi:MAG: pectin acetylesterase [Lachnospiraceae bacterium]|nr:pectin acetylesterase [Lachnospiraceae bacterium]